jgi:hypothetical protein
MKPHPFFQNRALTVYKKATEAHEICGVEALVVFKFGNIIHEYHTEGGDWEQVLSILV